MTRAHHILRVAAALLYLSIFSQSAFSAKNDRPLRFASYEVLESADPYFNNVRLGTILSDQVWDTLIYRDPETGQYKGNLATAWRRIDDRTLELDLRRGVRFHNGATFGADDVVYTVAFESKPENRAIGIRRVRWIDHIEKLDTYKIRIVSKQPFPAAIAYLAGVTFAILPHDYYAKVGPTGMSKHPVGTGPYRVVEHAIGKYIHLERNPDYFRNGPKQQPAIDNIEIRFVPDAQTRVAEIVSGGIDLVMNIARDQAEQLREQPQLKVLSGKTMRYEFLQIDSMPNTPAPQLRDVRVRQAIMYAIDRESIAKYVLGNGAQVIHVECHPTQFGCDDANAPRYAYDPDRARRLLAQAGYPRGFDLELYASVNRNESEAIVGYLGAVGVRARLRYMQFSAVQNAVHAGKVALNHSNWGSGSVADASMSASIFHEFSLDDTNKDPELRDLLLKADYAPDSAVRKETYAKALRMIAERAYVLPLYTMPTYYLAAKDLAFDPPSDEVPRFYEMSWK